MNIDFIEFGDKVAVNAVYRRRGAASSGRWHTRKHWERVPIRLRIGLYIGTRTLSNGTTENMGGEEGYVFHPSEHFKAALVVFSEREKPVLVPIGDMDWKWSHV